MKWIVIIIASMLWGYSIGNVLVALKEGFWLPLLIYFVGFVMAIGLGLEYTIGEVEYMGDVSCLEDKALLSIYTTTAIITVCFPIGLVLGHELPIKKKVIIKSWQNRLLNKT